MITTPKINSPTLSYSFRFTAQNSKTLIKAAEFVGSGISGSPVLQLAIYADDGTASHAPTGAPLAVGQDALLKGDSWNSVVLSPSLPVSRGVIYHLVVSVPNANLTTFLYLQYYPLNPDWVNCIPNANRGVLVNTGSGWSNISPTMEPVYSLLYSDNTIEGNGYVSAPTDLDHIYGSYGSSSMKQGFIFMLNATYTFNELGLVVAKTGTPANSLYAHIAQVISYSPGNGHTVALGPDLVTFVFAQPSDALPPPSTYGASFTRAPAWRTVNFTATMLQPGLYAVYLDSPGSTSLAYYDLLQSDARGSNLATGAYNDGRLSYQQDTSTFAASSHTRTTFNTEFGVDIPFILKGQASASTTTTISTSTSTTIVTTSNTSTSSASLTSSTSTFSSSSTTSTTLTSLTSSISHTHSRSTSSTSAGKSTSTSSTRSSTVSSSRTSSQSSESTSVPLTLIGGSVAAFVIVVAVGYQLLRRRP